MHSRPGRRLAWMVLVTITLILLVIGIALRWALRPEFATRLILQRTGNTLGLQITATGKPELRLRGTPQLIVREVVAHEPDAGHVLLRAQRIAIAVPWSTIRARGAVLDIERLELDAPALDFSVLRAWQAKRPPSDTRIPILRRGFGITDGSVIGKSWHLERIHLELPRLAPERALTARASGRYRSADPLQADFNLQLALTRPRMPAGAAAIGQITIANESWRLPTWIRASGPLSLDNTMRVTPLRIGLSGRYESGPNRLPFALGLHAPLRLDNAAWTLAPAFLAMRSEGALPNLDARGTLAYGDRLLLRLQGRLPRWNDTWPSLPPPLAQSQATLPFRLEYLGHVNFSDVATLQLQREQTRLDARLRLPDVLAWMDNGPSAAPLPPIQGRFSTPALEISGTRLEGVEVEISDPALGSSP